MATIKLNFHQFLHIQPKVKQSIVLTIVIGLITCIIAKITLKDTTIALVIGCIIAYIYRIFLEDIIKGRGKIYAGKGLDYVDNYSGNYEEILIPQGGQYNKVYDSEDLQFKLHNNDVTPDPATNNPMRSIRKGDLDGKYERLFYNKEHKKFLQLFLFNTRCIMLCCKCDTSQCKFTDNFKNLKEIESIWDQTDCIDFVLQSSIENVGRPEDFNYLENFRSGPIISENSEIKFYNDTDKNTWDTNMCNASNSKFYKDNFRLSTYDYTPNRLSGGAKIRTMGPHKNKESDRGNVNFISCALIDKSTFPKKEGRTVAPSFATDYCFQNLNYNTCMDYYNSWEQIYVKNTKIEIDESNYENDPPGDNKSKGPFNFLRRVTRDATTHTLGSIEQYTSATTTPATLDEEGVEIDAEKILNASGKYCYEDSAPRGWSPWAGAGRGRWTIQEHINYGDGSDHFECSDRNNCRIDEVVEIGYKRKFPYISFLGGKKVLTPEIPPHPCNIDHVIEYRLGTWTYIPPEPILQSSNFILKFLMIVVIAVLIGIEIKMNQNK